MLLCHCAISESAISSITNVINWRPLWLLLTFILFVLCVCTCLYACMCVQATRISGVFLYNIPPCFFTEVHSSQSSYTAWSLIIRVSVLCTISNTRVTATRTAFSMGNGHPHSSKCGVSSRHGRWFLYPSIIQSAWIFVDAHFAVLMNSF